MSLWFFVFGSLISSCAIVSQFGITGVVFHNDVMCRQLFATFNNSDQNEMACKNSLLNITEWNCSCRSQVLSPYFWIRISNEGTVAMGSLLFITLVILFSFQCMLLWDNYEEKNISFTSFELLSILGFLLILFFPKVQFYIEKEKWNILIPITSIGMLYDFFSIGLVYQYSSHLSIFQIVVIAASGVDIILRFIVNYIIRRKFREKLSQEPNMEEHQKLKPPAYIV